MTIPTTEPDQIIAGDTVKWRRTDLTDYPANQGWTLAYYFRNAAGSFDVAGGAVVADADGVSFAVTIAAGASAVYVAGIYDWIARVSKAGEVYTVDRGQATVVANIGAAGAVDVRTGLKRTLDALDAVLQRRAGADVQSWTVQTAGGGQQTLGKMTWPEILSARKYYAMLIDAEDRKAKLARGRPTGLIGIRF